MTIKLLDLSSQVCQTLWCKLPDNRCVTRLEPAAPGTSCAKHKVGKKTTFLKRLTVFCSSFYFIAVEHSDLLLSTQFSFLLALLFPFFKVGARQTIFVILPPLSVYHQIRHEGGRCKVSLSGQ